MLAILAFALSAAPQPSIALALQPAVGMTDSEVANAKTKIQAELTAAGVATTDAQPVEPACVPDPACVEQQRTAASVPALLVVEMVRLGPVVQLTATGSAGTKLATGTHGIEEGQLQKGKLLPENVMAWAKSLGPPAVTSSVDDGSATNNNAGKGAGNAGNASNAGNAGTAEAKVKKPGAAWPFTTMQTVGVVAAGVGVIALATGVILVGTSEPVLEDVKSTGTAKENARTLGWVGVGAATLGVVGVAAGAVCFFVLGGSKPAAPSGE
jgi:hypothetical protein